MKLNLVTKASENLSGIADAATVMTEKVYNETGIVDFTGRDVTDISVVGKATDLEECVCGIGLEK